MRRSPLPQNETRELFERGSLKYSIARPSYTKHVGDDIVLRKRSLMHPVIFIAALRDYVHALVMQNDKDPEIRPSQNDWKIFLEESKQALQRLQDVYKVRLTKGVVCQRMNGQTAEFLVARWIREMLQHFPNDDKDTMELQEWESREQSIRISPEYLIEPLGRHNFLLVQQGPHNNRAQEVDIFVRQGIDIGIFFDVSTSEAYVHKKLTREDICERMFVEFRERMVQLFNTSGRNQGLKDAVKIHVICTHPENVKMNVVETKVNGREAVIRAYLGANKAVHKVRGKAIQDLQNTGALVLGENGEFTLR